MSIHRNVATWERGISIALGAVLVATALRRRRPFGGLAATGFGLVARGVTGYCPVNEAVGRTAPHARGRNAFSGSRGIRVRETVTIARPAEELYDYWRNLDNLPRFMSQLESVQPVNDDVSHWVLQGPAGLRLEWDAELINTVEPSLIAWRSLPGASVASAGSVRFRPVSDQSTRVTVTMQYDPPAGKAGAFVNWLTGHGVARQLRSDLGRLKYLLEAGEVPSTEGQSAGKRTRKFQALRWVQS